MKIFKLLSLLCLVGSFNIFLDVNASEQVTTTTYTETTRPVYYEDEYYDDGLGEVVAAPVRAAGDVVEGAGEAAGDIIEGTGRAVGNVLEGVGEGLGNLFGR